MLHLQLLPWMSILLRPKRVANGANSPFPAWGFLPGPGFARFAASPSWLFSRRTTSPSIFFLLFSISDLCWGFYGDFGCFAVYGSRMMNDVGRKVDVYVVFGFYVGVTWRWRWTRKRVKMCSAKYNCLWSVFGFWFWSPAGEKCRRW